MKLIENFKNYNKGMIYELYVRLTLNFKEYDKITKSKMIAKIISDLSDSNTIIDLCITKELKLLNSILNKEEIDISKNIEILSYVIV